MIDVHCHLTDPRLEGYAPEESVSIITTGTSVEDSEKAVELAEKFDNVLACVGIHPEEIQDSNNKYINQPLREQIQILKQLTKHPKVVGIGEVGLDFRSETKPEEKSGQKKLFEAMVGLAEETGLPIVVHNRNADEDVLKILEGVKTGVLMHCFTRGREFMQKCAERGWYMSFGGLVTYENNPRMKIVVRELPAEWLLLETDAPYSVPAGVKSDINTPMNVKIVAEKVAEIRGVAAGYIDELTSANAGRLFKLT
jgi:TatD DNase family protein